MTSKKLHGSTQNKAPQSKIKTETKNELNPDMPLYAPGVLLTLHPRALHAVHGGRLVRSLRLAVMEHCALTTGLYSQPDTSAAHCTADHRDSHGIKEMRDLKLGGSLQNRLKGVREECEESSISWVSCEICASASAVMSSTRIFGNRYSPMSQSHE